MRRNSGFINVSSAFLRSFSMPVPLFCFIQVALSYAYSRDVTAGGYGATGGKYGIVLPVSNPSWPPTLKDRRAMRGGEINIYIYSLPLLSALIRTVMIEIGANVSISDQQPSISSVKAFKI